MDWDQVKGEEDYEVKWTGKKREDKVTGKRKKKEDEE